MIGKTVVATGGAGFIGSNLADELATSNKVIIIDDLSTGRIENIASLIKRDNVSFIQGSILDLGLLQESFRGADFVFHQAALTSVPGSIEDPESTNEVNVIGTLNVLLAARDNNVKKVIYASSCAVYGNAPTLPNKENIPPNPQSPYAVTKLVGEYYCCTFHQVYSLPTICLRYFNVYGPRQNANSPYAAAIPIFIGRVLQGKSLIIYGDGEQTRDFIFVKDVVKANILAAESDAYGVFNIGSGKSITISDLSRLIIKLMRSNIRPIHREPRLGDIRHSLADISKARNFGYSPEFNLEQGLRQTVMTLHEEQ